MTNDEGKHTLPSITAKRSVRRAKCWPSTLPSLPRSLRVAFGEARSLDHSTISDYKTGMRTALYIVLLLLGANGLAQILTPAEAQRLTPVEREVIELVYDTHSPRPKLFAVQGADRAAVIAMLRDIALKPKHDHTIKNTMVDSDGAAAALIRLGDEEVMETWVLRLRKSQDTFAGGHLHGALHPMLIPHLAAGLYDSENFASRVVGGDVGIASVPVFCARLILPNLQLEAFPQAMREQAKVADKLYGKDLVLMLRRWWSENKTAFEAREFQQVSPPK